MGCSMETEQRQEVLLKGKKRALRLLERKDYTKKELKERLLKDGYETDIVEDIFAYLDSFHYLDDIRVAGSYIRCRKEYKSKRELVYALKQKGVSEEEIELALEENYRNEEDVSQEEVAILRQLQKYHVNEEDLEEMSYEEKQKMAARLFRKGFEPDKIRKMLQM